jgi:GTPase SAR1 family protein
MEDVWGRAWNEGSALSQVNQITSELVGIEGAAVIIAAGCFLGLSVLWVADTYKRYQTLGPLTFLIVCLVTAGVGIFDLIDNFSFISLGLLSFSFLLGLQLGGFPIARILLRPGRGPHVNGPPYEFKLASLLVLFSIILVVLAGLFQSHTTMTIGGGTSFRVRRSEALVVNLLASVVLLTVFWWFTRYDHQIRVVQVGPARSGKSSLAGGLYQAANQETGRSIVDSKIEEIRKDIEQRYQFPPRDRIMDDDSGGVLDFNYVSGGYLFRKKTTVTGIDYPGELIVGPANQDSLSEQIQKTRSQPRRRDVAIVTRIQRRIGEFVRSFSADNQWDSTVERLRSSSSPVTMQALATLVDEADIVAFVLPLDDFIRRPVLREGVPDYLISYVVEEVDDKGEEYRIRRVGSTDDPTKIRREDGRLKHQDGTEFTAFEFESTEHLTQIGPNKYLYMDRAADRSDPSEYVHEYQSIVDMYSGAQMKSFVWVATMADLVLNDFKEGYRNVAFSEDNHVNPDIDSVFKSNQPRLPKDSVDYRAFAQWIRTECIEDTWPGFDRVLDQTYEDFVYPVWYDVSRDEDGELRINRSNPSLKGAQHLLDRFDGRRLVRVVPINEYLSQDVVQYRSERVYEELYQEYGSDIDT